MFGYATDLRSNTQGRAAYSMQFGSYEKVPDMISKKIIEERKKAREEREAQIKKNDSIAKAKKEDNN